jgi:hypothetical protein
LFHFQSIAFLSVGTRTEFAALTIDACVAS